MRLPVNHSLPLAALLLLGSTTQALARTDVPAATAPTGPAADYPVTVGEPYTIGSTTWTPSDQLNYDAVGLAGTAEGLMGVSGAHKTLPLPCYAEVTALDSGRTMLVRLVERGPRDNDTLIALSPAATAQLGMAPGVKTAVRVRRVNPPEVERAALRTGGTAPMRMETPESLLKVLRRKLAEQSPLLPPPSVPPTMPTSLATERPLPSTTVAKPIVTASPTTKPLATKPARPTPAPAKQTHADALPATKPTVSPVAKPAVATAKPETTPKAASTPARVAPAAKGTQVVQVAAFSTRDRADKAARALGGVVAPAGRLWRVRIGPFTGAKDATSALEKAKAAGYRDARIQRAD